MAEIPLPYRIFYLYVEPAATLVGAYFAWFDPTTYLKLTHASSAPGILGLPLSTHVALRQLGNLYLAFALNEGLVLRATSDLRVWRALLIGLLIADFGHLYSCLPLGLAYYYDVASWNAIAWGNIAFVYCGALSRICFLLGVGMGGLGGGVSTGGAAKKTKARARKSVRISNEDQGAVLPSSPSPPPPKELGPVTPLSKAQLNATPAQSTRRKKRSGAS